MVVGQVGPSSRWWVEAQAGLGCGFGRKECITCRCRRVGERCGGCTNKVPRSLDRGNLRRRGTIQVDRGLGGREAELVIIR